MWAVIDRPYRGSSVSETSCGWKSCAVDYLEKNFLRACSNASSGLTPGEARGVVSFGRPAARLAVDDNSAVSIPEATRAGMDTGDSQRFSSFVMHHRIPYP